MYVEGSTKGKITVWLIVNNTEGQQIKSTTEKQMKKL